MKLDKSVFVESLLTVTQSIGEDTSRNSFSIYPPGGDKTQYLWTNLPSGAGGGLLLQIVWKIMNFCSMRHKIHEILSKSTASESEREKGKQSTHSLSYLKWIDPPAETPPQAVCRLRSFNEAWFKLWSLHGSCLENLSPGIPGGLKTCRQRRRYQKKI